MLRPWLRSAGLRCVVLAVVVLGLAGMLGAQTPPFTYAYDEAGRLVGVVDASGNTTTYTYDSLGNIVSVARGSAAVSILEFSPNSGPAGTQVTVTGAGFSATAASNAVTFNGVAATVVSATPNQLVAVVPAGATTGPIRVTSPAGTAVSAASFVVGPGTAPTISGFTPAIGTAGSAVTITGTNFETAAGGNKVSFNGNLGAVSSATATTIGAVVPSTATSGHLSVTTPNGRAVSAGDFYVPPSPYTAADVEVTGRMNIGDTLAVPITVANKIGMILFDGAAGQRIALGVSLGTGLSGGSCDAFSIRRPDGALLASASACSASGFIDLQVLPVAGTYLITFDPAGTATGTATLTLHSVPADAAAPIIPGGAPVTVTTTVPGQNMQVSFSGTAGQRVSLKVSFGATCNDVSIHNPDGTALLSPTLTCSTTYFTDVRVLPATGVYVITVNPRDTIVGSVTLTLYDVPPDAASPIVPGGAPVTLTTTAPGQNIQATFSGTAGQRVSLTVSFGATCNDVSIQNPDGTALLSSTLTCSTTYFTDVRVLPATGVYVITVNPRDLIVESVTLTLYDIPADASPAIVPGGPAVDAIITTPGQNAQLNFTGNAGQRVSLNVAFGSLDTSTCNAVSIQNPDGTTLHNQTSACNATYFTDVLVLPATGTYTITINPGGTNVGTATLTLYDVPADASPAIFPGSPAVDAIITTPGQNAQLSFSGTAGQRVSLNVAFGGLDTSTCNAVSVQNPDGTTLHSQTSACSATYFTDLLALSATGTYTIIVNPGGTNIGTATLTLYDVPADASPAIVPGGSAVDVIITTPGQNAQVTFSGTAGQRVSLSVAFGGLDQSTCNTVSIQNPDGTALLAATCQSGATYFTDLLTLPATGTYTITINPGGMNVGTATLTLHDIPADASPAIVPGGAAVPVTITTPGQNAQVSFNGTAGQRVSLNIAFGGLDTSTCNTVSIQKPDGTALLAATCQSGATYFTDVLALTATGTYTITINPGGTNVGTATLTLYDVPADASPAIVPGGAAVGATITTPGQNAQVSFSGTAGQRVSLNVVFGGLDTSTCNTVSIQKPDGTALLAATSQCGASYFTDLLSLTATGTYTITLNPGGLNVGTATLTLYDVPADASPAIVPGGSAVDVIITTPGQNAQVSFSGTAGQRVSLNVAFGGLDQSSCNTVSIQKPDGTALLAATSQCGASYFTDLLTLTATGTYTITLNPGAMNVGTATLTLYDVPADASPAIVAGGSAAPVTITTPGQNAQVTFSGTVGQRVSLNVAFGGLDQSSCNTVSIQKPDGTALLAATSQCGASYFTDVLTLPAAGTYTITLNPGGLNVGTATLTLHDVPADLAATATVGGSAAALTTTVPGQNAVVSFSGSASQAVTVRMTGNTMGSVTVTLRRPDGTTQTSSTSSGASFNLSAQTLAAAGTYTILVNPAGTNIGSINVAITSP